MGTQPPGQRRAVFLNRDGTLNVETRREGQACLEDALCQAGERHGGNPTGAGLIAPPLISLLLPTRKRPARAQRFLQSVLETARYPEQVEIVLYADDDDPASHALACGGLDVVRIIGPQQSMGAYNSACLARARGDVIMLVNDDAVMRTHGWDEALLQLDAAIPDRIYLAYGDDQFKGRKLCTFPILSRRTCEVLLRPFHPAYRGAFIDYHLMDIFKRLEQSGPKRIFYLPAIVIEHLHYRAGKAAIDETYSARGRFDDDMLFAGLATVRAASLRLLANAIAGDATAPQTLPAFRPMGRPSSPFHAVWLFARIFLLDRELPKAWRIFLCWWFTARYMARLITRYSPRLASGMNSRARIRGYFQRARRTWRREFSKREHS